MCDARLDVWTGDHRARRQAGDEGAELVVGQPVVHRRERDAGDGGAEQGDGNGLGVDVDDADSFDAHDLELLRRPAASLQKFGGGEAVVSGADHHAVRRSLGSHLQEESDVHAGGVSPSWGGAWRL